MRKHDDRLKEELKNPAFKEQYEIEKAIAELAFKIAEIRRSRKWSQVVLAKKAGITQQQLSRFENGDNVTLELFFKICQSLNCSLSVKNVKT